MNTRLTGNKYIQRILLFPFIIVMAACSTLKTTQPDKDEINSSTGSVIEIATFVLKKEVDVDQFKMLDTNVEEQHVSKQTGFISRESALGENREWLVIVHWESIQDANASMASFANAPAAAEFMSKIDLNTMNMKHYSK